MRSFKEFLLILELLLSFKVASTKLPVERLDNDVWRALRSSTSLLTSSKMDWNRSSSVKSFLREDDDCFLFWSEFRRFSTISLEWSLLVSMSRLLRIESILMLVPQVLNEALNDKEVLITKMCTEKQNCETFGVLRLYWTHCLKSVHTAPLDSSRFVMLSRAGPSGESWPKDQPWMWGGGIYLCILSSHSMRTSLQDSMGIDIYIHMLRSICILWSYVHTESSIVMYR